jgi:hypothetical protein
MIGHIDLDKHMFSIFFLLRKKSIFDHPTFALVWFSHQTSKLDIFDHPTLQNYTSPILADFLVFKRILENVAKVTGQGVDTKGFDYVD